MMTKSFSIALALALGSFAAGCAGSSSGTDDPMDPNGDPTNPDPTNPDPTPKATDVSGKYAMHSTFDIASNMPGKVGDVVNTIISATDDPDDPTKWILDLMISKMSSGTFKSLLQGAEPFVAGYLNDELLSVAPDFVTTMVQMGNDFGDMAKHFGLNETLDVTGSGTSYMSVHTVTGAHFKIDTQEADYAFADYQVDNVVVNQVGVTLDATGKLSIASHKVPLSFGKILRIGMDAMIIPALDSSATNLDELLESKVDCAAVGQGIADAIGFGGASTFEAGCHLGLQAGADLIYSKIAGIDSSALEFDLAGTVKAVDTNSDHKADKLQTGNWTGTLSYAGTPAPLSPATFYGERM
jgi:hypothetical protein